MPRGFFGHAGRPGQRGGSMPEGEARSMSDMDKAAKTNTLSKNEPGYDKWLASRQPKEAAREATAQAALRPSGKPGTAWLSKKKESEQAKAERLFGGKLYAGPMAGGQIGRPDLKGKW
jgi:hypothetical protein